MPWKILLLVWFLFALVVHVWAAFLWFSWFQFCSRHKQVDCRAVPWFGFWLLAGWLVIEPGFWVWFLFWICCWVYHSAGWVFRVYFFPSHSGYRNSLPESSHFRNKRVSSTDNSRDSESPNAFFANGKLWMHCLKSANADSENLMERPRYMIFFVSMSI